MFNLFVRIFARLKIYFARAGRGKVCYACKRQVRSFLPYRGGWKSVPKFTIAMDVIGSDVENFSCPWCFAHDRERHLLMYFDAGAVWERIKNGNILHFAPETILASRIRQNSPAQYIQADLYPVSDEIKREDITNLSFPEDQFDVVIANHVLEHVENDLAALQEIFRVLKPGGLTIIQTPYSSRLHKMFHDEGINDDRARLEAYGQEDHVRLYGRDIFSRIEGCGFSSKVLKHEEVLEAIDPVMYGVFAREPFMCFQKPDGLH